MTGSMPPEWPNIRSILEDIASQPKGMWVLNCVTQRYHAKLNQLDEPKLAIAVLNYGSVTFVHQPTLKRLFEAYSLSDATSLLTSEGIRRLLAVDEAALAEMRQAMDREMRKLSADAVLGCANDAPLRAVEAAADRRS